MDLTYTKEVLKHLKSPKNMGKIKNPDGEGMVIRFSFRFFILPVAFLFVVWPCYVFSSTIHIATPAWEGQTAKDGSGLFFDLLRRVK